MPLTPADLGTVLSIWAHPDDETYLAGGIMAAARARGQRVVCASASAGERGTDDPDTWPPHRLGQLRRWEAAAAMAVLGVDEHHLLGLPDGELTRHDHEGVEWVGRLLDEVRPDTILTFGADGITFHPDHVAVHHWVTRVWHARGRPGRLLYAAESDEFMDRYAAQYEEWGAFMTDERPVGVPLPELALHVVLQGHELDRKVAALRAMATQTGGLIDRLGLDEYALHVAEEAFVAWRPAPSRWTVSA